MTALRAYWKLIVAALGAALVVFQTASSDDVIDLSEKLMIVGAFLGAALVFGATNPQLPFWRYTKAIFEALAGVTAFLAAEWQNGATDLTMTHWVALGIIVATALGVVVVPGPTWPVSAPPVVESGLNPSSAPP